MRKKRNDIHYCVVSALALTLVAAGCKDKAKPPPAPPPSQPVVKAVQPVLKAMSSAMPGVVDQTLNFTTKKDPFKPFVVPPPEARPASVARGRIRTEDLLPIQQFDVNKFRVSGIIAGLNGNTALLIDPAGKGYVVKEGMLIGNSDGRISRIRPSSIEVVEPYRDDNGHARKRTIVLTLLKKK